VGRGLDRVGIYDFVGCGERASFSVNRLAIAGEESLYRKGKKKRDSSGHTAALGMTNRGKTESHAKRVFQHADRNRLANQTAGAV
jgi:hypothetical protein